MARVLVVGADRAREQALLQRLRQASALAEAEVSPCHDLESCDLLVIHDTPAMRTAAANLLRRRPRLRCWVHDRQGRLLSAHAPIGEANNAVLDDGAISQVLRGLQPPPTGADELARGSHAITRLLRQRVPERQGCLLLRLQGQPLLLLDLQHEQAIALHDGSPPLLDLLVEQFAALSAHALTTDGLQVMAGDHVRQPLRPLLWQWGLRSTHWQALDARLTLRQPLRLLRWPDFRVLGGEHDAFRLCSLLLKRALSVQQCAVLLELPEARVLAFVHAAYLSGHARLEPQAEPGPSLSSGAAQAGSLLAGMWRSMRGQP